MNLKAIFTIILVFCVAGCSTLGSSKVSNETLYGAIVKSGEEQNKTLGEIVKLLSAKNTAEIKTEVRKEETTRINERKLTIGTTISDEEILGVKTATDRNTLSLKKNSTDSDTEKRLGKLEKKVAKLEKSDKRLNQKVAALEASRRFLSSKIDEVGIQNLANLIVNNINGKKLSDQAKDQIKIIAEKLNELAEKDGKYNITVTVFDSKGKCSEKLGNLVGQQLAEYLNDQFSVSHTTKLEKADKNHANMALISNPFI